MSHLSDELQEQYEDFRMLARKATKESLDQPDWTTNTECVNIVKTITDPDFLYEIAQLLMRRLRESHTRIVVLTLYLIDALAHHCGHALLLTFNDEVFMQQVASVARKYYTSPAQLAISTPPDHEARQEAVSVCLELLSNWSTFFRARRAYYSNIVDMYEILESEGIVSNSGSNGGESSVGVKGASGAGQNAVSNNAEPKRLTAHHSRRSLHSDTLSLTTNDRTHTTTERTSGTSGMSHVNSNSGRTSHSNSNNISSMLNASSRSTDAYEYSPRTMHSSVVANPTVHTTNLNHASTNHTTNPTNANKESLTIDTNLHHASNNNTNSNTTKPTNTTVANTSDVSLHAIPHAKTTSSENMNMFHSPHITSHPWLSREERGMQSKSDYSKTTLDSHEQHYKRSNSDVAISPSNKNTTNTTYTTEVAEAKQKLASSPSMKEHKNSKANMNSLLYPTNAANTTNTGKTASTTNANNTTPTHTTHNNTMLSPPHTTYTTYPRMNHLNESTNTDEDFGVMGDAFDDFVPSTEVTPTHHTTNTNTSNKYQPTHTMHTNTNIYEQMQPISPDKPAQRALHEFLTTNTIDDAQLQDELLNQVEIEKRIQDINKSRSVDPRMHMPNMNLTINTKGNVGSNVQNNVHSVKNSNVYSSTNTYKNTTHTSTLQHELQHQHEIERSIQEQRQHTSTTNTTTNYTSNNHYTHTTANSNNTTAPLLNDIRNFQYNSDDNLMYNSGLMDMQYSDNAQVPPRSPHGRHHHSSHAHSSGMHNPYSANNGGNGNNISRTRSLGLDTDSEENYDGHLVDYADGTNMDFFYVPSTNTYIDTEDKKHKEYMNSGSGSNIKNVTSASGAVNSGNSNVVGMYNNTMPMGSIGMHNGINTMTIPNTIPTLPNMYGPTEFVSLTTTQYNFAKVPSFYSGININMPMNNNMGNNMVANVPYYNAVNNTHSNTRTTNTHTNTTHTTTSMHNTTNTAHTTHNTHNTLLNTHSNNSLLLDQQIEQQKLILQEFERQKQLQTPKHITNTTTNNTHHTNTTHTTSTTSHDIDHTLEVNIAKERLLRQQANMLSSGASASVCVYSGVNSGVSGGIGSVNGSVGGASNNTGGNGVQYNNNTGKFFPPTQQHQQQPTSNNTSAPQRRGLDNLTLRTAPNSTIDGGSLYGSISGASGAYSGNNAVNSGANGASGVKAAVNRAMAGTPHTVQTTTSSTHNTHNTSNNALKREKERLAQRKQELEHEWAAEQQHAIEHTTEHTANHNTTNSNVVHTTSGNVYSGRAPLSHKMSAVSNMTGNNVITSSNGRKYNITHTTHATHTDLDNDTLVSDLTCSSVSTNGRTLYTSIENEPVAVPLTRAESFKMQSQYTDTQNTVLPARVSSSKLESHNASSNNVSQTNTTNNTTVNSEDPVLQSVAQLLKEALDPALSNTNTNSTSTSAPIDRVKALAAAQLLIATLTGTPAPTPTHATHATTHTNNATNLGAYPTTYPTHTPSSVNDSINRSSSNDGSRQYPNSVDISDVAIARSPYPHTTTTNTNTNQATTNNTSTYSIHNTLPSTGSMGMPPRSPSAHMRVASSGNLTATSASGASGVSANNSSNVRSKNSERYLVPDVVSNTNTNTNTANNTSNSGYPERTTQLNTVALQSGISVITDSSYHTDTLPHRNHSTHNSDRGRSRTRPGLSIGIGGMDHHSSERGERSSDKLHRSSSVDAARTNTTNTSTANNTKQSGAANANTTTTHSTSSHKMHRSASLDRKHSSGSHFGSERGSEKSSERSSELAVSRHTSNGTLSNGSMHLSNGSMSGPPSPLTTITEHSGSRAEGGVSGSVGNAGQVSSGGGSGSKSRDRASYFAQDEHSHANTNHTSTTNHTAHTTDNTHTNTHYSNIPTKSIVHEYDSTSNSGANLVATALLNRGGSKQYRSREGSFHHPHTTNTSPYTNTNTSSSLHERDSTSPLTLSTSADVEVARGSGSELHSGSGRGSSSGVGRSKRSTSRSRSPRLESRESVQDDLKYSRDTVDYTHTSAGSGAGSGSYRHKSSERRESRGERRSSRERNRSVERKDSAYTHNTPTTHTTAHTTHSSSRSPDKGHSTTHRDHIRRERDRSDRASSRTRDRERDAKYHPDPTTHDNTHSTYRFKYQLDDGYRDANGVDNLGRTREMRKAERAKEREERAKARYGTTSTSGYGDGDTRGNVRTSSSAGVHTSSTAASSGIGSDVDKHYGEKSGGRDREYVRDVRDVQSTHSSHSNRTPPVVPPLALPLSLPMPPPVAIGRVGSRDRGDSFGVHSTYSTGVHSTHSGVYSNAYSAHSTHSNTPIERVGSRDSGSRGSSNNSANGKVSLVELARSRDPSYKAAVASGYVQRRIYEDELSRSSSNSPKAYYTNNNHTNTNSSAGSSPKGPYTSATNNTGSVYAYPSTYAPRNTTHNNTSNSNEYTSSNLGSISYDSAIDHRAHANNSTTSSQRRTSHEPSYTYNNTTLPYSASTNNISTSRPVAPHRTAHSSAANTNTNSYANSYNTSYNSSPAKHNNYTSDDDMTRLSRPIDSPYTRTNSSGAYTNISGGYYNEPYKERTLSTNTASSNNYNTYNNTTHSTSHTNPHTSNSTTNPNTTSGDKKWVCNMCTLENPPAYLACDACGMLRSK